MATEKGFFREAGLEIALSSMVGGAAIQPALASGAISIGWTNVVSMCQGHLQGFDFRFVANGAIVKRGTHDFSGLMGGVDSPIKTGKDLEGKVMGINTLGNITQATAMAWVDKHGGDSIKLKWVNALGLEHAAIPPQRIEDAGEAAGEGDDGDLLAAARGDTQGPGPQLLRRRPPAEDQNRGLNQEPAGARVARRGDRPRRCVSPELYSRGTRPR